MRKALTILAAVLLASAASLAREDSIDTLKQRAQAAKPGDQAKLFSEIARREVEAADQLYTSGESEKAKNTLRDAVFSAERASHAAEQSGKQLKETEIKMRKLSKRVDEIKHTLAVEDRPPLDAAIQTLEQLRRDLLARMFGRKGKS